MNGDPQARAFRRRRGQWAFDVVGPQPERTVLERTDLANAAFDAAIDTVTRDVVKDVVARPFAAIDEQHRRFWDAGPYPEPAPYPHDTEKHARTVDAVTGEATTFPGILADRVRRTETQDSGNPKDAIGDTKPQIHLVPPAGLIYEAKVMALGASKYGAYNWRDSKVRRTVYLSAILRHVLRSLDGEDVDPETGVPHEASIAANAHIILDALANDVLIDDRPTSGAAGRLIEEASEVAERKAEVLDRLTRRAA